MKKRLKDDVCVVCIIVLFLLLFAIFTAYHEVEISTSAYYDYDDPNVKAWILEKNVNPNSCWLDTNSTIRVDKVYDIPMCSAYKEIEIISKYIKRCNNRIPKIVSDKIGFEIVSQSYKEKIPIELLIGIIQTESTFDPSAISSKMARGLMQVLDDTCKGEVIDKSRLHDIDYNIYCGIKIFKSKLDLSRGDFDKALFYYVGRDSKYSSRVYRNISSYIFFKSEINNIGD